MRVEPLSCFRFQDSLDVTVAIPNSDLATVAGNNQVILKFREKDSLAKKICHLMNIECEKKLLGLISACWVVKAIAQ